MWAGMIKALNIASQGMMQAERRATDLAGEILKSTSQMSNFKVEDADPAAAKDADAAARPGTGTAPLASPSGADMGDLIQQMVDLRAEANAFKANAEVFKRTDEALGSLLDDEG